MKTYTLKEVSKKINVTPSIVRQWEKDFVDYLDIPRSKQGARIYSDLEIDQLLEIKQMAEKKISKDAIRQWLQKVQNPEVKESTPASEVTLEIISEKDMIPVPVEESALKNTELFFEAMETYKKTFLNEIKDEIRSVVRKEVLEEVKKEITKGTYYTVKSISDSVYKSTANTKAEILELSNTIEKASETTADSLQYLAKNMTAASLETSEEIFSLSKQLSETSNELSHYVDLTNSEISSLSETISKDREFFVEERNQYRHEVTQRELAFQQMLTSFRDVAAAREKKWWKFWS
ncbi:MULTISPECIES: MerR family transcriptional regulator [Bacillaceae]|uniref:MerR family transcriptional regulator n=1 Tax=Bacillaceae TaxID=186817 RepID=UPI0011879B6D|nr:MerR family transcriptional regulator [Bacillus sp. S3]QCJ43039.1 MerR family transcriptional regulator [Bacillus sp. S3]